MLPSSSGILLNLTTEVKYDFLPVVYNIVLNKKKLLFEASKYNYPLRQGHIPEAWNPKLP
jgi:hypothetical protein